VRRRRDEGPDLPAICTLCGFSHDRERRWKSLRRLLSTPMTSKELAPAHPCWWSIEPRSARARCLTRDLHSVGAVQDHRGGDWRLP
jgi:hypothetical protein